MLARAATYFEGSGADVRYIDALAARARTLKRKRVTSFQLDQQVVNLWRFGKSAVDLKHELVRLSASGWSPHLVLIECFASFWWRGAREAAMLARQMFPAARIAVVDTSGEIKLEQVKPCAVPGAGDVRAELVDIIPFQILTASPDWELGGSPPAIGYVTFAGGARSASDVINDIERGLALGVRRFSFSEFAALRHSAAALGAVLEHVVTKHPRASFSILGNVSAFELLNHRDLLPLMKRTRFQQVVFADDRTSPVAGPQSWQAENDLLDAYQELIPLMHAAGFPRRSDAVVASLSLGRANENLASRSAFAARLAHVVGSVIIWPYQPTFQECANHGVQLPLELQNGRLYPLRSTSGATYRDYLNVMGLAVVLNSKYREQTFDFMGPGFIARLFRDSIARRAWEPEDALKGTLRLPALPPKAATESPRSDATNTPDLVSLLRAVAL